jgi:hypothetical protein
LPFNYVFRAMASNFMWKIIHITSIYSSIARVRSLQMTGQTFEPLVALAHSCWGRRERYEIIGSYSYHGMESIMVVGTPNPRSFVWPCSNTKTTRGILQKWGGFLSPPMTVFAQRGKSKLSLQFGIWNLHSLYFYNDD